MDANEPINLERERRIRRKITALADAIAGAGERERYEQHPTQYLEDKAIMADERTYTVADVAELFDVNPDTVRRWCRDGEIQAAKIGSAGYRVSRPALEAFWRKRGGGRLFGDGQEISRESEKLLDEWFDDNSDEVSPPESVPVKPWVFAIPKDTDGNHVHMDKVVRSSWNALAESLGRTPNGEETEALVLAYQAMEADDE